MSPCSLSPSHIPLFQITNSEKVARFWPAFFPLILFDLRPFFSDIIFWHLVSKNRGFWAGISGLWLRVLLRLQRMEIRFWAVIWLFKIVHHFQENQGLLLTSLVRPYCLIRDKQAIPSHLGVMFCLIHKVLNELGRRVLIMKRVSVKHQWACDMGWCLAVTKIERKDTKEKKKWESIWRKLHRRMKDGCGGCMHNVLGQHRC